MIFYEKLCSLVFFVLLFYKMVADGQTILMELDKPQTQVIKSGQSKIFKLKIKEVPLAGSRLYIEVNLESDGFFERPEVHITSDNDFYLGCYDATDQFTNLCWIPQVEVKQNRQFSIKVQASVENPYEIYAYINTEAEIFMEEPVQMAAKSDTSQAENFFLKIPANLTFTDIGILARIDNQEQVQGGFILRVNFGNDSTPSPTAANSQQKGQRVWGNGAAVFLTNEQVKPGNLIKIFVMLSKNMKLTLVVKTNNGKYFNIYLSQPINDFVGAKQQKVYKLNISETLQKYNDKTLQINAIIYSGDPSFDASFTDDFSLGSTFLNEYAIGTVSYLLDNKFRKQKNFTGLLYIRVKSNVSSTYYIQIKMVQQTDFVVLKPEVTQIDYIVDNQVVNYLFEKRITLPDNITQKQMHFYVKLDVLLGNVEVGVRRCIHLQRDQKIGCLIMNTSVLQQNSTMQTFADVDLSIYKTKNIHHAHFSYDVVKCTKQNDITINGFITRVCDFQILVGNQNTTLNPTQTSQITLTFYEQGYIQTLRQGVQQRSTVQKGVYNYYKFDLHYIENVTKVAFYMTVLQGDAILVSSTESKFPKIQQQENTTVHGRNMALFEGENVKTQYYIGIFGYEISDFTLVAIVDEKVGNETIYSNVELKQSIMMNYTLPVNTGIAYFRFYPQYLKNTRVDIVDFQGHVTFAIYDSSNKKVLCLDKFKPSCIIKVSDKSEYIIKVLGPKQSEQVFTISYQTVPQSSEELKCFEYPMNHPIYVMMEQNSTKCFEFVIGNLKDLEVMLSVPSIDLLESNLRVTATIGKVEQSVNTRLRRIGKEFFKKFCNASDHGGLSDCSLKLHFITTKNISFLYTVEQIGQEMVLFDGVEIVSSIDIGVNKFSKYFSYTLYQNSQDVRVMVMSETTINFNISLKLMEQADYVKSNEVLTRIYPNQDNALAKQSTSSSIVAFKITAEQIKQSKCDKCVLLITVDGQKNTGLGSFRIEATQLGHTIEINSSKVGYVEQNEVMSYEISNYGVKNGVITVSSLYNDHCFRLYASNQKGEEIPIQSDASFFLVPTTAFGQYFTITLQGKQSCSYEISYTINNNNLREAMKLIPYTIKLDPNATTYFVYHNRDGNNFRVIARTKLGSSTIYAKIVEPGSSVIAQTKKSIEKQYNFTDDGSGDAQIQIVVKKGDVAHEDYFLIAVKGSYDGFEGDIIILPYQQPIPMKSNLLMRQKMKDRGQRMYALHTMVDIDVAVTLLYGKVNFQIVDPAGKELLSETLSQVGSTHIKVPYPQQQSSQNLFSDSSQFYINVISLAESSFYFSLQNTGDASYRLHEGYPIILDVSKQPQTILLSNPDNDPISIVVEVISDLIQDQGVLVFKAFNQNKSQQISISQHYSQNNFNLQILTNHSGIHYLTIASSSDKTFKVSTLYIHEPLTFLVPSHQSLFRHEGIFEVHTSNKSMMIEIYECTGKIAITGSKKYRVVKGDQVSNSSDIVLDHSNYGGHYVVSSELMSGQYFINVRQKGNTTQPLTYFISYYEFNSFMDLPYRHYDIESKNVEFENIKDSIIFKLKPVYSKQVDKQVSLVNTKYTIFIAKNDSKINQLSQCLLGSIDDVLMSQLTIAEESGDIRFQFKISQIEKYLGDQSVTFYYVGARASLKLKKPQRQPYYPENLQFTYNTIQMNRKIVHIQAPKTNTQIAKMVVMIGLPFLIGSVFILLGCRYCVKRYYAMYPTQLVEQDVAQSHEEFKEAKHEQIK